MTRMLLCSEGSLLARGLESVLGEVEGFELLPSCRKPAGLMEQMTRCAPDLLLLNLTTDVTYAVLGEIKRAMPECKVVLWVDSIPTQLAFQALALGVRGILRKTLPAELHVQCLQRVQAGGLWFEKALASSFLAERHVVLSAYESRLVGLLSLGMKNKEIAAAVGIPEFEVNVSLSRLFRKVDVKDRFELALFGLLQKPMERSEAPTPFPAPLLSATVWRN
jgi:DNA-binding NarL/FixJ family response regulator